jgi:hypothetical protein
MVSGVSIKMDIASIAKEILKNNTETTTMDV